MLRSLLIAAVLVSTLGVSACNSGNKEQQPTADEQKRIQDRKQKSYRATEATYIRIRKFHERMPRPIPDNAPEKTKKQQAQHHKA